MEGLNKSVNSTLKNVNTPFVENVLKLLFILYATKLAPEVPQTVMTFFMNPVVKFFVFFLIVWINSRDTTLSLTVALIVVMIVNFVSGRALLEMFKVEQDTDINPGCLGLKMKDILEVFNGDDEAMKQTLYNIQVPLNVPLDDENAPLLATYLMNHGYTLGGSCHV